MKKEEIVQDYRIGPTPRILDTINCFRHKFDAWPTKLLVDKDMADAIQQHHLTPLGWLTLTSKIDVQLHIDGEVIAEDDEGHSFQYDATHHKPEDKSQSADYWVWGCAVWP